MVKMPGTTVRTAKENNLPENKAAGRTCNNDKVCQVVS